MQAASINLSRRDAFGFRCRGGDDGVGHHRCARTNAPRNSKGRIRQSVTGWPLGKIPADELCRQLKEIGLVGLDLVGDRSSGRS
jgi:hypothetical protein